MQQKWHAPSHGGLVESDFGGQEAPVSGHWHRASAARNKSLESVRRQAMLGSLTMDQSKESGIA